MHLNDIMSFDHVVQSDGNGNITDVPLVWAPEVIDSEGTLSQHPDHDGWHVLNGWSGQSFYAGPVMHPSEYIGGGLADFIYSTEGQYVALVVYDISDTDDSDTDGKYDAIGWVIAMRLIPEGAVK
jgi:hypothetical protein